jgi:hypothetical protein
MLRKSTKIWLNYITGITISFFLLWSIYGQVMKQISGIGPGAWKPAGPVVFLWASIALMLVNTSLEGYKWYLLTSSVAPLKYFRAFSSYLAGIAFSIITPNRIGEYPGRILYLGKSHTFRYINVSVLGVVSQLSAVYFFGFAGLIYYNFFISTGGDGLYNSALNFYVPKIALAACFLVNIGIVVLYLRFEEWLPAFGRIRWLRRFITYARLLNRITMSRQMLVLGISLLRFFIFSAQFLSLLRYMNVGMPVAGGFCMAALFFWIMAVIPSVTLTELGIRGKVSLFLFRNFSSNTVGIITAMAGLWLLNLIIPSIVGSILIMRMKLLR